MDGGTMGGTCTSADPEGSTNNGRSFKSGGIHFFWDSM